MKNVFRLSILAILLAGFLTACPASGPRIETIQLSSGFTAEVFQVKAGSLNLEARQSGHLLYSDYDRGLTYARKNGNHWGFKQNWDLTEGYYGYGSSHDLALDNNENVHISSSISDGHDEDLGYVNNVTGFWITARPDAPSGSSVGMYSKNAVDHNGKVHILHYRWNDGAMLYTTNAGVFWHTEQMPINGTPQTILVDSQNQVHVFAGPCHLTNINGQWQTEEVLLSGYGPAAAIDENDNLYVLTNGGLWFKPVDGVWQDRQDIFAQMIEDSAFNSVSISGEALAIDEQGNLHVAFSVVQYQGDYASNNFQVYYGSNQSGSWQAILIDQQLTIKNAYEPPAVVVNADDEICFAYLAAGQIYFLTFDPGQLF